MQNVRIVGRFYTATNTEEINRINFLLNEGKEIKEALEHIKQIKTTYNIFNQYERLISLSLDPVESDLSHKYENVVSELMKFFK